MSSGGFKKHFLQQRCFYVAKKSFHVKSEVSEILFKALLKRLVEHLTSPVEPSEVDRRRHRRDTAT